MISPSEVLTRTLSLPVERNRMVASEGSIALFVLVRMLRC